MNICYIHTVELITTENSCPDKVIQYHKNELLM